MTVPREGNIAEAMSAEAMSAEAMSGEAGAVIHLPDRSRLASQGQPMAVSWPCSSARKRP